MNATKERQAWCCLQVKLCDPCLSALYVLWFKNALYKYSSFPFPFSQLCKVLFVPLSVTFGLFVCLFVYEISPEPLNGFATNSQARRVSSLARASLNVKVKSQRLRSPGTNFLSIQKSM